VDGGDGGYIIGPPFPKGELAGAAVNDCVDGNEPGLAQTKPSGGAAVKELERMAEFPAMKLFVFWTFADL